MPPEVEGLGHPLVAPLVLHLTQSIRDRCCKYVLDTRRFKSVNLTKIAFRIWNSCILKEKVAWKVPYHRNTE